MRPARLVILFLAALLAAGCARRPPPPPAAAVAVQPAADLDSLAYGGARRYVEAPPPAVVVPVANPAPRGGYTLDSGDKLRVVVFGQDGLTNSYSVDAGGNITMPLIGSVPARGLTTVELTAAISARLKQGFIREPHVAVEIETYRPFFILGEVTYPGQYPFVANMTVETAVAIAGGFTPRAFHTQVVISRTVGGQTIRATVPATSPVRPGDTITVSERWF
jgi:polysaccharide export outer membrane protein